MRRMLLLMGLLAAAVIGAVRLLRSGEGTLRRTGLRAADTVRQHGPDVANRLAQGIERVSEWADTGVQRARERLSETQEGAAPEAGEMPEPPPRERQRAPDEEQ